MGVRCGDRDLDRQARPVRGGSSIRSSHGRLDSVRSAAPFEGPDTHRVDGQARPVQPSPGTEFVQDDAVETGPHPVNTPAREASVDGRPGRAEHRRHLPPRAARRGDEHDRGQTFTVPGSSTAITLRPYHHRLRHHAPEQLPQLFRHQPLGETRHAHHNEPNHQRKRRPRRRRAATWWPPRTRTRGRASWSRGRRRGMGGRGAGWWWAPVRGGATWCRRRCGRPSSRGAGPGRDACAGSCPPRIRRRPAPAGFPPRRGRPSPNTPPRGRRGAARSGVGAGTYPGGEQPGCRRAAARAGVPVTVAHEPRADPFQIRQSTTIRPLP